MSAFEKIEDSVMAIGLTHQEMEGSCSNRSENSCDIKLDISRTLANDSPLSTYPSTRPLFAPSVRPNGAAQLFQTTCRPDIQYQKSEQTVKDESFCKIFRFGSWEATTRVRASAQGRRVEGGELKLRHWAKSRMVAVVDWWQHRKKRLLRKMNGRRRSDF
ncbi:homeobox-leucine zipper ATHB-13-like [Olea europaea subsp. europaea]|uniref:Homeobox-leucine zipper ATHB-13-like n=1 Tax=Olea europaea subsp. europaea TaxID=158383 RepID=A0A8S0Q938_OLEEU|nr:homeobox-leucine zipper ATHB-13-like [Olea europaea subsp. europaea]